VNRILVASGLALWVGSALLLSEVRWFARRPLTERLRTYVPGGFGTPIRAGVLSVESFRDAIGPAAHALGERFSRAFGIAEDLATRLRRVHSPLDVTAFRVRQVGWATAAFGAGLLAAVTARPPVLLALLLTLGAPLLAFLAVEQRLALASARWQRNLRLELPVVAEQIGMLLGAGYSLSAALDRVASRGQGACARDLRRVTSRVRQGLAEADALREWAATSRVDAVERFVSVLALNREASDLGRLIGEEARAIRRDVQRDLLELMQRRAQQVWIPVTVATLVPGVIFVAIPFVEALRVFGQ
jgi:Flp pilus assembly protein TadB